MPIDVDHELTKGFAARLIRQKARQLIRRPEFSSSDRPDLEQEMKLNLLERLPKFDAKVAHWNVFVTTIVERHVATLLKHHTAEKRTDGNGVDSLSTLVNDGDANLLELAHMIGPEHRELLTGRTSRSDQEQTELRLDLEAALAKLPVELRALCERLKTQTLSEIAKATGVPRTTLADRLYKLRQRLGPVRLHVSS